MNSNKIWQAVLASNHREHKWWTQIQVMFAATKDGRKGIVSDRLLKLPTREEVGDTIDADGIGGLTHTEMFIYTYAPIDPDFYDDLLLVINEQRGIVLNRDEDDKKANDE